MALGTGLAASIGISQETTYGTYVAPARFHEFNTETLNKVKNFVQGGGLAAGRFQRLGSRRVVTTTAGAGTVTMEVTNKRMGLILQHLMGSSTSPVQQASTAAYLQTHALGDSLGKYLTVQKGVPDTGGTVRPYTFLGCKIPAAEFSCAVDENLVVGVDFDARSVSESQSLAAPSFTTGTAPFHFGQMNVKLGTFGAEAAVTGVKGVTCRIERPLAVDRFYANAGGVKDEPLMNDFMAVTGTVQTDFTDKTAFADRFASDGSTSLVLEWVGPLIASTYFETFRIKVPMVFFDDGTPQVGGPEIVSPAFTFTSAFDGTNLPTIEYMSVDTTV